MGHARSFLTAPSWLRLPPRTARLRLTLFYCSLFLVSGAAILAITYVLVVHSTGVYLLPGSKAGLILNGSARGAGQHPSIVSPTQTKPTAAQLHQLHQLQTAALDQRHSDLHQLLVESAIALEVMAVLAVAAGWVVAGRVLRPVRTITSTARRISASNLHQRLALEGPADEFKELGDTLDELLARLEASFSSQRHFVANAAHELRTPLTVDRTLLQVALKNRKSNAYTLRSTCEALLASNTEQERMIEALLILATSERGLEHPEPADLAVIASDAAANFGTFGDHTVRLTTTLEPAAAEGDPDLLRRLVTNLVDNALRYNVSDGWVKVTTGTRAGHAVLAVSNTGPEVPGGDVHRLFEPFERLGPQRATRAGGHGLGLSIVSSIAQAHGANILAEPRPGGGLDVEVRFPALNRAVSGGSPKAELGRQ